MWRVAIGRPVPVDGPDKQEAYGFLAGFDGTSKSNAAPVFAPSATVARSGDVATSP